MEKINGIVIDGKFYEAVKDGICKECAFDKGPLSHYCPHLVGLCEEYNCIFRYSPSLTERLNNPKTKE
jgi:hypothetical protein